MNEEQKTKLDHALRDITIKSEFLQAVEPSKEWNCYSAKYRVSLFYKDREILSSEYSMGEGHFKVKEYLASWHSKSKLHAMQILATKKQPTIYDVMYSFLSDGEVYFQAMTFDDFCDSFGYANDSIKAKKMYDACMDHGLKIARAIPEEQLKELKEAFRDY